MTRPAVLGYQNRFAKNTYFNAYQLVARDQGLYTVRPGRIYLLATTVSVNVATLHSFGIFSSIYV